MPQKVPHKNIEDIVCCIADKNRRLIEAMFNKRRTVLRILPQTDLEANSPRGVLSELVMDEQAVLWILDEDGWRPVEICVA